MTEDSARRLVYAVLAQEYRAHRSLWIGTLCLALGAAMISGLVVDGASSLRNAASIVIVLGALYLMVLLVLRQELSARSAGLKAHLGTSPCVRTRRLGYHCVQYGASRPLILRTTGRTPALAPCAGASRRGIRTMSPNRIIVARFSPTGRTRRLMSMIAQGLAGTALPVEELDLTDRWEREEARTFGKGDLVFLGVPVYFGRVPLPMQSLAKWTGNGAAAVPVAAYGCRAHEDTLRELAAVLRAAGFVVPAGAAFPVEHSQFPEFGAGRPNEADRFSAGDFARRVFETLRDGTARFAPEFPGEGELRSYPKTGFVPMPDPVCRMCGRCAEVCPMDIIDPFSMRVKDPSQCIGCRACIDACPDSHRNFPEPVRAAMAQVRERIRPACEAPKFPEFFF